MRSAGKPISMSTSKKRKAKTSYPNKKKGKSTSVQSEKKSIENTLPLAKKRKIRTLTRKKTISLGTNQSSPLIVIDESPQVSPKYHNLLVLANAVAHTMVNEENVEDDISLSTFVRRLRKRKTTPSVGEVQADGHEDDEEQHEETLDNFDEQDIETLNLLKEQGTKAPCCFLGIGY